MSIWCSWEHIGTDPTVMYEVSPGIREIDIGNGAKGRTPVKQVAERGNVLSYASGWSNHYPDLSGEAERPAVIALAHMPEWCVPGHDDTEDYDINGPWLRLEVVAPETLNFWEKDADGGPAVENDGASVVLDEEAARSLRDDLTRWLDRPKVHPLDG